MTLEQRIHLETIEAQRLGELGMSDESTSEGFDEEGLLGDSIEVDARGAELRSHVLRNLEANLHYDLFLRRRL